MVVTQSRATGFKAPPPYDGGVPFAPHENPDITAIAPSGEEAGGPGGEGARGRTGALVTPRSSAPWKPQRGAAPAVLSSPPDCTARHKASGRCSAPFAKSQEKCIYLKTRYIFVTANVNISNDERRRASQRTPAGGRNLGLSNVNATCYQAYIPNFKTLGKVSRVVPRVSFLPVLGAGALQRALSAP